MTLRIGQTVVQIQQWTNPDTGYPDVVFTRPGVIYTVRETLTVRGINAIRVYEIVNPKHRYRGEPELIEQPFPAWNFRPLVERKTDISIFKKLLIPSDKELAS